MKNRITTNSIRTIKKSLPRFLSLMIMSMLGVFAFSGLQATAPDMLNTLDSYLDKYNSYDIKIISTMGLVDDDIEAVKNIEGVEEVEKSYSKDIIIETNASEVVVNISSIPTNIGKLELLEGKLPNDANQIVVEPNMLTKNNLKIGDTLYLDDDIFKNKEVTIVGTIKSSLYFNNASTEQNRGNTGIGSGKINYYAYMLPENFDQDYYTSLYVTVSGAKDKLTSSNKYIDLIDDVINKLEDIKSSQEDLRYNNIYEANSTYQENLQTYNENLAKYNEAVEEYNKIKEEADAKIADSRKELEDIEHPVWYIYDRTNYTTYSEYIDDSNSITNLSKIFPTVFFAVAILVSLISMNRMVEEDRLEIGTLKSLGFSNSKIMSKYALFSLSATVVGSIIGSVLGLIIIPLIIFSIYGMLFDVPDFKFGVNYTATILGFIIVIVCVCGTSILTVYKVLKEKPSDLMRPKAPKSGKRVFLENIKFIWNHIKFSNKVTIRNLFRYKKRVLVTVGGIAGCTALMLCGFGIRDAIVDIANMQYIETFKYDAAVYTKDLKKENITNIFEDERIKEVTQTQIISAKTNNINVNLFIVENNEELKSIANLVDRNSESKTQMESGKVIITDKLADLAGLNVGDTLDILDVNNVSYKYEISAIVKNYLGHYIYIDKDTYESSGQKFEPNVVYLSMDELSTENKKQLSTKLLENDEIISVSCTTSLIESADNMLKSLNKVVVILIVLAAMLSFVVLYNLSNININERKREIATLKVLGFYDKEVDSYITKENILLTILGIVIGLVLGYFLTKMVITTVEIEKARFIHNIKVNSYIYASVISAIFTWIVNIITHFNLKKIDMIESLKSVE